MKTAIQILDEMIEQVKYPSDRMLLQEAKERIQKETQWIKVSDRLPEEFIELLTYWPDWMCVDSYENPNNRTYRNWFHRMSDTTHYMPLPLPPKE